MLGRSVARDAVRNELQDVEARDALAFEQPRGLRLRLLEHRGQDVAGVDLGALRALHVQHRRLQHPAERGRLLGLALLAAPQLLDRLFEEVVQLAAQPLSDPRRTPCRIRSPSGSCASA